MPAAKLSSKISAFISFTVCLVSLLVVLPQHVAAQDSDVVAEYVITVADAFVVDVYQNGKLLPDQLRHGTDNFFGTFAEQDDIKVKKGDWLVFHVVYTLMRDNGVHFFAAAGLSDKNQFGFVSNVNSGDWSSCEDPSDAKQFISDVNFLSDKKAQKIPDDLLWDQGIPRMKKFAGHSWKGTPIWGKPDAHSVWLKVIVN